MSTKTVFVTGGDGFVGWPAALRLSKNGWNVVIIDNLSRRHIDIDLGSNSVFPIASIQDRIKTWEQVSGKKIEFHLLDLAKDYEQFENLLVKYKPNSICHFAEQRAAPYSMKNTTTRRYTVNNNVNSTHNVLCAVNNIDPTIHIVHMGTAGVYGYGAIPDTIVPEGYVKVQMDGKEIEILHPALPGSIYHTTKVLDADLFQFYARIHKLKITDLHQGIIWDVNTEETKMHEKLNNRLDYDSDYGTVLNRFIIEAIKDVPLTIYGTGEQTRSFINIQNSMDCIELALKNPPTVGERVKIFNQITETKSLLELKNFVLSAHKLVFTDRDHEAKVSYLDNPRIEMTKNSLQMKNKQFLDLGLGPILLNLEKIVDLMKYISSLIQSNSNEIKNELFLPISFW